MECLRPLGRSSLGHELCVLSTEWSYKGFHGFGKTDIGRWFDQLTVCAEFVCRTPWRKQLNKANKLEHVGQDTA